MVGIVANANTYICEGSKQIALTVALVSPELPAWTSPLSLPNTATSPDALTMLSIFTSPIITTSPSCFSIYRFDTKKVEKKKEKKKKKKRKRQSILFLWCARQPSRVVICLFSLSKTIPLKCERTLRFIPFPLSFLFPSPVLLSTSF